jgi:hypothetical protein
MADQSVRVTNFPDSGSRERVAYDLWNRLRDLISHEGTGPERVALQLELYRQCLEATARSSVDVSALR